MFAVGLSGVLYVGVMGCDGFGTGDKILSPFSHYWQAPMDYDDSRATRVLNVAAVCPVVDLSPEVNRARMVSVIDRIKTELSEVRLVLFPEMVLGYYYRPSDPGGYQKSVTWTTVERVRPGVGWTLFPYNLTCTFGVAWLFG